MNKKVMITGANSGLGKDAARQLALMNETEKIYLACRNLEKAQTAKSELEKATKRNIFEIVVIDVSNLDSVKKFISKFDDELDAIIMNAGGFGSRDPLKLTKDGVSSITAANLLGHAYLLEELLKNGQLKNVALYAGSEAARGVEFMKIDKPDLGKSTEEDFISVLDGSRFDPKNPMESYAYVKYAATLWMSSLARQYPEVKFITMSPGSTSGTAAMDVMPFALRFMYKYVMMPIVFKLKGMVHTVDVGAKRYVDGISEDSYESGAFYASAKGVTGKVIDQAEIYRNFANEMYQDNASKAIHKFLN